MKTKLVISLLIIAIIAISQLIKPEKNISKTNENGSLNSVTDTIPFFVGAYCDSKETNKSILVDTLSFNFWHTFLENRAKQDPNNTSKLYYTPVGWNEHDSLYYSNDSINQYVKTVLDVNGAEIRTLMSRPKIEWLFFAQRSDYQCETESFLLNHDYNWFYTYNEHPRGHDTTDDSPYGQGAKVMYCRLGMFIDSGYVVRGLKANREQVNTGNPGHGYPYPGYGDGQFKWYVKPRIRIDSTFAANPGNNEIKICRIEVYNYEGTIISGKDIKVKHFKPINNPVYSGNYLDNFYDRTNDTANTIIPSGWQMNPNDSNWMNRTNCQVDYRVFWYGLCDMWIDYVRVEDYRANILFGDSTSSDTRMYYDMIQQEVRNAKYKNSESPLMFYIDEFEFNHIPAITFVMKKLQQYAGTQSPPFTLSTNNPYDNFYSLHLPTWSSLSIEHFKQYCLDSCKVMLYAKSNSYPFVKQRYPGTEYQTNLPNTLPDISNQYVYANVVSPDIYENWLQRFLVNSDTVYRDFIPACKKLQNLSILKPEMNSFISIQTHAHNAEDFLRETTNEEIRMMVNTALSYGIKGIMYYSYDAFGQNIDGTVNPGNFDVGLTNKLGNNANNTPRYINFYGQRKWESIANTNRTLKKWSPYLRTFSNLETKSYVYNDLVERSLCLSETYFSDIVTYKPGTGEPNCVNDNPGGNLPPGLTYDCNNDRYIQAATFQTSVSVVNEYFMIVNRRCSPYIDSTTEDNRGGRRNVRVRFDINHSSFSNFNNWEIIDIDSNKTVAVFDKRTSTLIDLGWYMPGQGKLYKIVPVMVEGGTFVCDEYVSSSAGSFECKGNITNNGYELEIEKGVTINFKDNVGINFSHSNFKCGISGGNTNNVFLKGSGNEKWNGINFSECNTIQIETTTFQDIKYSYQQNLQNTAICLNNCANFSITNSTFLLTTPSSGIYAMYSEINEIKENIIGYNSFEVDCSYSSTPINLYATGPIVIPVLLQSNTLENKQSTDGVGISISNITGGAIKSNGINNFSTGINSLSSTLDISGNIISSDLNNSIGIFETAESDLNLGYINSLHIGGDNLFSNLGTGVNNILTEYSTFNINEGYNTFNVYQSNSNCHLRGIFCGEPNDPVYALYNCFQVDENNTDQIVIQ